MIKVTITAFGDEHEFIDDWNAEEIDILINAPVMYLVSGYEDRIEGFASDLIKNNSDWTVLYTEAHEYVFFGYEYFSEDEDVLIEVLGLCYEREERCEHDEIAA